ncbi:htaa family protein [Corynebacterium simulans]|nr:htaa family protein [Corynebacterium simulans]
MIPFNGNLSFKGHNGVLDMNLSDFQVHASGNRAEISVDYVSYELDRSAMARGQEIRGDNEVIAIIDLQNPVKPESGSVNLTGSTTLTQGGNRLFTGFYEPGEALDPSSGTVGLDGSCAAGKGTGDVPTSITGKFTGFNKEAMAILSETNDTMNGITTFMGNTEKFLSQLKSFYGDSAGNSGGTAAGGSNGASHSAAQKGGDTKSTGASTASGNGSQSAGTKAETGTQAAGAAAAGSAGNGDEKCEATGVTQASAAWGVKKSFQSYITGSIAQGRWDLNAVGYENERFTFNGNSGAVNGNAGSIQYSGSMHFSGHHGKLDLNISNLAVTFNGNSGQLIGDVSSSNMEGEKKDFGRTVIGDLSFSSLDVGENSLQGEASVALSETGSEAFAGFYEPGTQLDPLSISADLGGSADCAAVTGGGSGVAGTSGGSKSGSTGAGAAGKNADAASLTGGESQGYQDGSGNFKIKSAAAQDKGFEWGDSRTYLLLLIAGLVIAGGSTSRLVMQNPA